MIQLAYAYKKPTIATAIAPFMEIVEDEVTGFICEPNNSDSLSNAINKALDYSEDYLKMGIAGADIISKKFLD